MGISITNLVIILVIVLILFGAGKLPKVMGDLGKGLKNFKDGLNSKDEDLQQTQKQLEDKKNDANR